MFIDTVVITEVLIISVGTALITLGGVIAFEASCCILACLFNDPVIILLNLM